MPQKELDKDFIKILTNITFWMFKIGKKWLEKCYFFC